MPMDVTGLDVVQRRLQDMAAEVVPILGIALQQEADAILAVSKTLVPVLTGALRASGEVGDVQQSQSSAWVDITYGDNGRIPYAAKQHFDSTLNHPRGGQAFYLQQPFFAAEQGYTQNLADAVVAAL